MLEGSHRPNSAGLDETARMARRWVRTNRWVAEFGWVAVFVFYVVGGSATWARGLSALSIRDWPVMAAMWPPAGASGLEPVAEVGGEVGDVHLGLLQAARVVPVHRLPAGELVEHPYAGLAAAVA